MRYQVWDEDGLLRSFWTRNEATEFMLEGMRLVVLPKPKQKTNKDIFADALKEAGEALI